MEKEFWREMSMLSDVHIDEIFEKMDEKERAYVTGFIRGCQLQADGTLLKLAKERGGEFSPLDCINLAKEEWIKLLTPDIMSSN